MAGRGSRLRPHTLTVPKPLIPVAGKPIVQRLAEDLTASYNGQVEEIAFIIGDFGDAVEKQLIEIAEGLGAKGSVYRQEQPLGTAHAILCAADSLSGNCIVAFADTLFKADLNAVYSDNTINTGDIIVVTDNGDGEYAVYVANQDAPTQATHLTTLTTRDSATVDAGTLTQDVIHTSGNVTLGNVSNGSKVVEVTITVTTVFDSASAGITVGDDNDIDRLFSDDYVDLTSLGSYVVNPNFIYTGTLDSANTIKTYITQGTATQGNATVTVIYQ